MISFECPILSPLQQRRKLLRDTWYFTCECERCVDNVDHKLTAILCPNCPIGDQETLCIFGSHPYKDPQTLKLTCPSCEKMVANEYVAFAIETMRTVDAVFEKNDLAQMKTRKEQLDFLEEMFQQYARVFPPTNVFLGKLIQGLIERVSSNEDLLRLHLASEPCVRLSFPKNHPAVAFHIRNIGLFLSNLEHYEESIPYFEEADGMLTRVLDVDHTLTQENKSMLVNAMSKLTDLKRKERFANLSNEQRRQLIEQDIKKLRFEQSLKDKKEKQAEKEKEFKKAVPAEKEITKEDVGAKKEKTKSANDSTEKTSKPLVVFTENFDDLPPLVSE